MRYLVMLQGTRPASPPPPELMEAVMALGAEAGQAGVLLDNGGFLPQPAAQVTVAGGHLSVMDGPFTETKEYISYAVYDVTAKADVVEWTSRFMQVHRDKWPGWEGEATILKVMGPEDFQGPPPAG